MLLLLALLLLMLLLVVPLRVVGPALLPAYRFASPRATSAGSKLPSSASWMPGASVSLSAPEPNSGSVFPREPVAPVNWAASCINAAYRGASGAACSGCTVAGTVR
uniref:Putative secreted protein n=1 Tax=Anopheles darlingi TaxID=43151 RepID=A0A2M4DHW6_ANODA